MNTNGRRVVFYTTKTKPLNPLGEFAQVKWCVTHLYLPEPLFARKVDLIYKINKKLKSRVVSLS